MDVDNSAYRIPSALMGRRRHVPIPTMAGQLGKMFDRLEEKAEYFLQFVPPKKEQLAPNPPNDRLVELRPRKAACPDGVNNSAHQRLPE